MYYDVLYLGRGQAARYLCTLGTDTDPSAINPPGPGLPICKLRSSISGKLAWVPVRLLYCVLLRPFSVDSSSGSCSLTSFILFLLLARVRRAFILILALALALIFIFTLLFPPPSPSISRPFVVPLPPFYYYSPLCFLLSSCCCCCCCCRPPPQHPHLHVYEGTHDIDTRAPPSDLVYQRKARQTTTTFQ